MAARTEGVRAKAAAMLAAGAQISQICDELQIVKTTLWRWRQDPEFRSMVDQVVAVGLTEAGQQLRALAPAAVEAFERGLGSEDEALAVRAADIVTRRIPELMPRSGVDVELDASERVAALIRRLDASDDRAGSDDAGRLPAPPGPAAVRGDHTLDTHEA